MSVELANQIATLEYYKLNEAARVAHITTRTLYTWTRDKGLPIIIIDGIKRIKRADLEDFMDSHVQG